MTTESNRVFFGSLESVRGLAALSVAVYHCGVQARVHGEMVWDKTFWQLHDFDEIVMRLFMSVFSGSAAVSMFFVLSGFVLYRSLYADTGSPAEMSIVVWSNTAGIICDATNRCQIN